MRQVVPEDAPELARLIQACELDDNPNEARIASVILNTSRVTVAETGDDGDLIGFVDAFMTVSPEGSLRWEVDLLGVHPAHRGRGVAQRLINASVEAGREQGAQLFRAIVKVDNSPSLAAFQRNGFADDGITRNLYVSDRVVEQAPALPPDAHLISVCTLTYSGIWVEGENSLAAFICAQALRVKYGWDIAGALSSANTTVPSDYAFAGQYLHLRRKVLLR